MKKEGLPKIISVTDKKYSVKSCSSNIYTVLLENALDLPPWTCANFFSSKMLCKHICAVMICCNLSWQNLEKNNLEALFQCLCLPKSLPIQHLYQYLFKSLPIQKKREKTLRSCKTLALHRRNKKATLGKVADLKKGTIFYEMFGHLNFTSVE